MNTTAHAVDAVIARTAQTAARAARDHHASGDGAAAAVQAAAVAHAFEHDLPPHPGHNAIAAVARTAEYSADDDAYPSEYVRGLLIALTDAVDEYVRTLTATV